MKQEPPARHARRCSFLGILLAFLLPCPLARAEGTGMIIINEIMYHPQGGGRDLEFIELYNATPAPIDISGWFFSGISYTFPDGTFLNGRTYLVVAANADRIRTEYGINNVLGNWAECGGQSAGCALDNGGEAIELIEHNGVVQARVRYDDRGKWPAEADGTGHSLELETPYREQDDPDSWLASGAMGGSPGKPNTAAQAEEREVPVVINEALLLTAGERWIELFNEGDEEVDLSGYSITNDRGDLQKARLPEGTRIAPRGWLVFTETELGLDLRPVSAGPGSEARTFVALTNLDASRVIDAYIFEPEVDGMSEARIPDGDKEFADRADPTRGAANHITVESDVVINEILFHPIDEDPQGEFLELYNRGDRAIDLTGWRVSGGIDFSFPTGTAIAPDGYLVVARDAEHIREVYGLAAGQVVGPDPADEEALRDFGRLRDSGERINLRDPEGKLADTVRYHDGGEWPDWADGSGSSLELIDPWQDNNTAAAWDASDDSAKASVMEHIYTGNYTGAEPELRLLLLGRGITVLDDLKMFQRTIVLEPLETYIEVGDEWKYFKGTEEPSDPKEAWRQPDFDDSSWLSGPTPIGFGEDDEATVIEDMRNNYASIYCRKDFFIDDPAAIESLVLDVEYDDGYFAYLNGVLVTNQNMRDGEDNHTDTARTSREKAESTVDLTEWKDLVVPGRNVLAVQVHNAILTSADLRFIPRLRNGRFVNQDGPNLVENGDFEQPLSTPGRPTPGYWFIEGNHDRSGRTAVQAISGQGSLKIVANGRGDNKVNRLEVSLPPLSNRPRENTYTISFKTRWVVGAQSLVTQGYDQSIPRSHPLGVPSDLGTPGAPNSATLRRIARTGSANIGPVIDKVRQDPTLPGPGQATTITARVRDPDGVSSVKLYWALHSPALPGSAQANEIVMSGPDARGRYTAVIPGQTARTRVVYSIVAEDAGGRTGRFPIDPIDRTHPKVLDPEAPDLIDRSFAVYRHDTPLATRYLSYRFWMDQMNETYMTRRELHSNSPVPGTFIFENRDIYYGAHIRFSGSPFARGGWNESFRVAMPKDEPLHGAIRRFQMEDHQRGGPASVLERLSNYLIRHNQGHIKVPFSYQWLVQWQVNDRVNETREHVQYPNRELISRFFPDDDEGDFFEMDDRHLFNDGGSRVTNYDGRLTYPPYASDMARLGLEPDDKELYRWYFNLRQKDAIDDYTTLIELAKVLTPSQTPNEEFDRIIWDYINVEEFLRVWSIRMNTDDWDQWGASRGKNCYLYRPPNDGRYVLLPWDMELTYESVNAFMPPAITGTYSTSFQEFVRFINRPRIKRMYYGIMKAMIDHQFNSQFLGPYRARLAANGLVNLDRMAPNGYIDQRKRLLENVLRSAIYPQVRLRVTTNAGNPITTDRPLIEIAGIAPVEITQIVVTVNDVPTNDPLPVEFSNEDPFGWAIQLPVQAGTSSVAFLGFDINGTLIDMASIDITGQLEAPVIAQVSPAKVAVGDRVTIEGTGFYEGIHVFFGDVEASEVDYASLPASISAVVPAGVLPGPVDVIAGISGGSMSKPFTIEVLGGERRFIRGDVDSSLTLTVVDGLWTLQHLFSGRPLGCLDAADTDDSGVINVTDAVITLNYVFLRGVPPAPPFPEEGVDPTEDDLDCGGS